MAPIIRGGSVVFNREFWEAMTEAFRVGAEALEERDLVREFSGCGCPSHEDQAGRRTERPEWMAADVDAEASCDALRRELAEVKAELARRERYFSEAVELLKAQGKVAP